MINIKINSLKEKIPRWEEYRVFFNLKIVFYLLSWFALVPIVVNILHSVPEKITLKFTDPHVTIHFTLPFKWEILWFSSFSFFASFIFYLLFIPKFIKKYHNYIEYKNFGNSPRHLVWDAFYSGVFNNNKFIERMREKGFISITDESALDQPKVTEKNTYFIWSHNNNNFKFSIKEDIAEINEREIFWEVFGRNSEKFFWIRAIILSLLLISLILFAVVVYMNVTAAILEMK